MVRSRGGDGLPWAVRARGGIVFCVGGIAGLRSPGRRTPQPSRQSAPFSLSRLSRRRAGLPWVRLGNVIRASLTTGSPLPVRSFFRSRPEDSSPPPSSLIPFPSPSEGAGSGKNSLAPKVWVRSAKRLRKKSVRSSGAVLSVPQKSVEHLNDELLALARQLPDGL